MEATPKSIAADLKGAIAWQLIRMIHAGWARPRLLNEGGVIVDLTDLGRDRLVQVHRCFGEIGWPETAAEWPALRELCRVADEENG